MLCSICVTIHIQVSNFAFTYNNDYKQTRLLKCKLAIQKKPLLSDRVASAKVLQENHARIAQVLESSPYEINI